jgi:hypothetical protein
MKNIKKKYTTPSSKKSTRHNHKTIQIILHKNYSTYNMPYRKALNNTNDDHDTEKSHGAHHNSHEKYENSTNYTKNPNN